MIGLAHLLPEYPGKESIKLFAQVFSRRFVIVNHGAGEKGEVYQLLQYDDKGKCVVKGPIKTLKGVDLQNRIRVGDKLKEETIITVERDSVEFTLQTPVIYHGLNDKCHLNGKIGVVVNVEDSNSCTREYLVSFEEKGINPDTVKKENLSVLFELPLKNAGFVMKGSPVVCHGLKYDSEKHLNGKLGSVVNWDKANQLVKVKFEDPDLNLSEGYRIVKAENLNLSFDFPKK